MLQERTVFSGSIVEVTDVKCRVTSSRCSCEEHSPTNCIVIPRRGAYVRHVGKQRQLADPTHALFFTAGDTYRVSHPAGLGDDCTALTFDDAALLDVLETVEHRVPQKDQPFRSTQVMLSPRTVLLGHKLFALCSRGTEAALEIEEQSMILLGRILSDASREVTRQAAGGTVSKRQRELLEAIRFVILSNPGQRLTLTQLARTIGCSPFHLTRLCRRLTGAPLHQYLVRLRMAIALERIRGGATPLSPLAFELGFSSHSHFTATFRRIYGVSPSSIRQIPRSLPITRRRRPVER